MTDHEKVAEAEDGLGEYLLAVGHQVVQLLMEVLEKICLLFLEQV